MNLLNKAARPLSPSGGVTIGDVSAGAELSHPLSPSEEVTIGDVSAGAELSRPLSPSGGGGGRTGNELFPVFLKLNELKVLLVGAGNVGLEKLQAILGNSPETQLTIVATAVRDEVRIFTAQYPQIKIFERPFTEADLEGFDIAVIATADNELNTAIRQACRARRILINVADKPELCDFYLGSIVKKGDLKIGISTNGKSPTMAKRLKEIFQNELPDQLDASLQQMNQLRNKLKGDFAYKVQELNKVTAALINSQATNQKKISTLKVYLKRIAALFSLVLLSCTISA